MANSTDIGTDTGFAIYHHPHLAKSLEGDRQLRAQEHNRETPFYLPFYTEVWTKRPKQRRDIYKQFLRKPIIYQGLKAEERWREAVEHVHELDRDWWAVSVMNRSDAFYGEASMARFHLHDQTFLRGFIRQKELEGELGYAAMPIPFNFEQLSGFFEFVWNFIELLTLEENWLPPRRIDKPDVWRVGKDGKVVPFPASDVVGGQGSCPIRPRNPDDERGSPHLLELVAGHACNFKIEFGPHLLELPDYPIHRRSGLSARAIAKRVVISVTMNEGNDTWAALGPRIVLTEAPLALIEYVARILTDPIRGIGPAWHNMDGREQEAFLMRPKYYPLPAFHTGQGFGLNFAERSTKEMQEEIRRCWMQRKWGQSFEFGDGPWNSPWPQDQPGDNVPEPVVINGQEYRPTRVSARPLTQAVDFTKVRPPNWGMVFKDDDGKEKSAFPRDKRRAVRTNIVSRHKEGAFELYDNRLVSKWDKVGTSQYEKAGRARRTGPRPTPVPQRRLTPPASWNPITASRSAGSSNRHRTAMPATHRPQEPQPDWGITWDTTTGDRRSLDDWGIPPHERPAPVVPTPPAHSADFSAPPPQEAFVAESRARHFPDQERARQQAQAEEEEKQKERLRQQQAEEQTERERAEARAREEQERAEFQTLCREIRGARERHDTAATDTHSEVSFTSSSAAWNELDRALERTYHKETFHWQLVSIMLHERAKAQHLRLIHRAAKHHHQQWLDTLLFRCGDCNTRQPAVNKYCGNCGFPNPRLAVMDPPPQPAGNADATPPAQPAGGTDDPPPAQAALSEEDERAQALAEFFNKGSYTAPDPIQPKVVESPADQAAPAPITQPTIATGDLAADQMAGIYETPQLRPARTPFVTPDLPQLSGLFTSDPEVDAQINQFAATLADAMQAPSLPEPAAQQQQASSTADWTSHFTRQQDREDRGDWPDLGPQQAQWQERWHATQEPANNQGAPLSLDEMAQTRANRLWRVQEEPSRPQRTFADLPAPADALPHFQPPIPAPHQNAPNEAEAAVFTDGPHDTWRDAPPMTLEERLSAATSYGGRFYVCFSCVERCRECGNSLGHKYHCSRNNPAKHGRTSHSQLYWLREEGLFVWPYGDEDWKEFLPDTPAIREIMADVPTLDGVRWRDDVWRRAGNVCRQGGYVISPFILRDAIHRDNPPFAVHCSGLSGRTQGRVGTTPTLQMNGRPSFQQSWYISYCVSWNQLNKTWEEFVQFQEGAAHLCPCPKPRGACLNEERCNYVWCDRWDRDRVVCPSAVWHRAHEDTFLF